MLRLNQVRPLALSCLAALALAGCSIELGETQTNATNSTDSGNEQSSTIGDQDSSQNSPGNGSQQSPTDANDTPTNQPPPNNNQPNTSPEDTTNQNPGDGSSSQAPDNDTENNGGTQTQQPDNTNGGGQQTPDNSDENQQEQEPVKEPEPEPKPEPEVQPEPEVTEPPSQAELDYDYILANGVVDKNGYGTRYWDGCKAHCGWSGNTDGNPVRSCNKQNEIFSSYDQKSACDGGEAYTCWDMSPRAVSDTLAFGFAAVPGKNDDCGKCFEFTFTGQGYYDEKDIGSGKLKTANKKLVVMATNIGHDVGNGQFDILIPGGGVGIFDAASEQWGVSKDDLGNQYGGFLRTCRENLGWNASHDSVKECVRSTCGVVFNEPHMSDLRNSCDWFIDWFEVADNPEFTYSEVSCPQELLDRAYN